MDRALHQFAVMMVGASTALLLVSAGWESVSSNRLAEDPDPVAVNTVLSR